MFLVLSTLPLWPGLATTPHSSQQESGSFYEQFTALATKDPDLLT